MAYDDAYWSYGWTAQSMGNSYDGAPITMPPTGLREVPVVGSFYAQSGKPMWGRLTFTASIPSIMADGKLIVMERIHVFSLDGGKVPTDFVLLCPDGVSPAIEPLTWSWEVTGRIGPDNIDLTVTAPPTDSQIDLVALISTQNTASS